MPVMIWSLILFSSITVRRSRGLACNSIETGGSPLITRTLAILPGRHLSSLTSASSELFTSSPFTSTTMSFLRMPLAAAGELGATRATKAPRTSGSLCTLGSSLWILQNQDETVRQRTKAFDCVHVGRANHLVLAKRTGLQSNSMRRFRDLKGDMRTQSPCKVWCERHDFNTKIGMAGFLPELQYFVYLLRPVDRNGETNGLRVCSDHSVDANYITSSID